MTWAQHCWPVRIRLVANNDIQVIGLQVEHEVGAVAMVITPVIPMDIDVTTVMSMLPVMAVTTFFIAVFVVLAATVPVAIIMAMTVITIVSAVISPVM
jgi:hypothetical protein